MQSTECLRSSTKATVSLLSFSHTTFALFSLALLPLQMNCFVYASSHLVLPYYPQLCCEPVMLPSACWPPCFLRPPMHRYHTEFGYLITSKGIIHVIVYRLYFMNTCFVCYSISLLHSLSIPFLSPPRSLISSLIQSLSLSSDRLLIILLCKPMRV